VNSTDVRWLTAEHVEDRSTASGGMEMEDQIAAMLGGGQSVGGVVSDPTGTTQQVIQHHHYPPFCTCLRFIIVISEFALVPYNIYLSSTTNT